MAGAGIGLALLVVPTPAVSGILGLPALSVKVVNVAGTATNTITSLVFNDVGTISIEAVQEGHLTHFGHFTGHFSYVAVPSPVSIVLLGTAQLTNDDGETLSLTAVVAELGTDYPYTVAGTLTVTGGTGRFAGATGALTVSGPDSAELSDTLSFRGTLVLKH